MSDWAKFASHLLEIEKAHRKALSDREEARVQAEEATALMSTHVCSPERQEAAQVPGEPLPTVETDYPFQDLVEALRANADSHKEPEGTERRRAADAIERLARSVLALRQALAAREVDQ